MTPREFIVKWRNTRFGEKQASQEMFLDICALVEHPTPVAYGNPAAFTFEKWIPGGFADAYLEGHFAWEFKGRDAYLDDGMNQLLRYQVYLKTPPLLIVSSFRTIRIRTNFPGMETVLHEIPLSELDLTENLKKLRRAFHAPADFRPDLTVEKVTRETADIFQKIVADMENRDADPEALARYLNQIIFCLYAQDAGLLNNNLFTKAIINYHRRPNLFNEVMGNLFAKMSVGGLFGIELIRNFNGDLYNTIDTIPFSLDAMQLMVESTAKNWRSIEPSIFGTLFERALDASKRSQLGAHYTSADDIELVVEPVVMEPLRREWEVARQEADSLIADGHPAAAREILETFRHRLAKVTVLDPACGSGNFLYITLRALLDLEKQVIDYNDVQGWDEMHPAVRPNQMMGMEINPYAAELARTALWIGYIQWHQTNGVPYRQDPILAPMNNAIQQTDAILTDAETENPQETEWPAAEFIIGNPPFLGQAMIRSNLGRKYTDSIYAVYKNRLPRTSDLCCYWFEKARANIASGKSKRAGLLATQGIRGQANREVLQRIKDSGNIFMAYQDLEWVLDGAAVRISIVGFDDGSETEHFLNGISCGKLQINANLQVGVDLTQSLPLQENAGICFRRQGSVSQFDIDHETAQNMIAQPVNVNGRPNSDVIRPVFNGADIVGHSRQVHRIAFDFDSESECAMYEQPFEHIKKILENTIKSQNWWRHERRSINIERLESLSRYIATPRVSKHRIFVWLPPEAITTDATVVFLRQDDYFFGVLHSRIHEVWALESGTRLESRPRYTPTTCFETFPFPEPTDEQRVSISAAAIWLNELRENALRNNAKETLTALYNRRPSWLDNAHAALDAAVAAAYGWPPDLDDTAILERLLDMNLQRSEQNAA